jgi:hypothetical protein
MKKTTPKMTARQIRQFAKANSEFLSDYRDLCEDFALFSMKWGNVIGIFIKDPADLPMGRGLGVGYEKEMFK